MRKLLAVLVCVVALGCARHRAESANSRGKDCVAKGDNRCAIAAYAEAVRLRPDEPRYHFNLGRAYGRLGHYDMAAQQFSEVLRLDPSDIEASRFLSMTNTAMASRNHPD